jgi:hypothetical protein
MSNETLLAEWRERFDDYSRSGLSVSSWCAANDIPLHRYYYWRRRLSCDPATPTKSVKTCEVDWLGLSVSGAVSAPSVLPVRVGTAVIDVAPGFDPALLRAVVSALEAAR